MHYTYVICSGRRGEEATLVARVSLHAASFRCSPTPGGAGGEPSAALRHHGRIAREHEAGASTSRLSVSRDAEGLGSETIELQAECILRPLARLAGVS
jgi:hypothetical protein